MLLSILICSYNKKKYLQAILLNLNNQTCSRKDFEVCLVIDGSTDGTIEMADNISTNYQLNYYYIKNRGLAEARNYGIQKSKGKYIVFCDDDTFYKPDFLERLKERLEKYPNHIHAGNLLNINSLYSNEIINNITSGTIISYNFPHTYFDEIPFFTAVKKLFENTNKATNSEPASWWAVITGGNICIPSDALSKVDGFDPNIKGWGPEDADLCYSLFKEGYNGIYNEECQVFHLDHERNLETQQQVMMKNAIYFIKKFNKPKELIEYLRFMNGIISLNEFNNICSEIFNYKKIKVPEYYLSMEKYSNSNQLIKFEKQ